MNTQIIANRREFVIQARNAAEAENRLRFSEGYEKATEQYIYENQKMDANEIVRKFMENDRRVISITKKTKVGMDGLMIEVATLMTTHPDDSKIVNCSNVRIITGMSCASWEKDMKEKSPSCFKDKIFHHGQLGKADLKNLSNALIIIDEIDTGDKELQVLHNTLKDAGVMSVQHMMEHNNRFMFASATMIKELYDLYRWGDLHELHQMTIPASYIGHNEFLDRGIVQEFYSLNTPESAEKWIREDILNHYDDDFRVHIVRVTNKTVNLVQNACISANIEFRNHTSTDRLSSEEERELFKEPLTKHVVLGVKGFFRRAILIPNKWKLRIGATHELYTKKVDNNTQIQGLPGRMTGYWRDIIEGGHKTGPYRTSTVAVKQYEANYNDPFGNHSYQSAGFRKSRGRINSQNTMLTHTNIEGLIPVDLPETSNNYPSISNYRIYSDESIMKEICKSLGYGFRTVNENAEGFKETSLNNAKCVVSLEDAIRKIRTSYGTNNGQISYRVYYPCYLDKNDKNTLRYLLIIRPNTEPAKIREIDEKYPSIRI
jgi:hypothetical protein